MITDLFWRAFWASLILFVLWLGYRRWTRSPFQSFFRSLRREQKAIDDGDELAQRRELRQIGRDVGKDEP